MLERIIERFYVARALKKYRNSLPTETEIDKPKMEYHIFADGVVWEDEGIASCHPSLENAFRYVLSHRTGLITNKSAGDEDDFNQRIFHLAKEYFPNWIGFANERCSYNAALSQRIERIRLVSEWKIEKTMNENY